MRPDQIQSAQLVCALILSVVTAASVTSTFGPANRCSGKSRRSIFKGIIPIPCRDNAPVRDALVPVSFHVQEKVS